MTSRKQLGRARGGNKAVLIEVPEHLVENYRIYASVKGTTLTSAVAYALQDWMESVGQGHIEDAAGCYTGALINNLMSEVASSIEAQENSCIEAGPKVIKGGMTKQPS